MSAKKDGANRWGCELGQGVCRIHKGPGGPEPLVCRHGCQIAKVHECLDLKNATPCLTPECGGIARSRGICSLCRKLLQEDVDAGLYAWVDMERVGAVLPIKASRRPSMRGARREYFRSLVGAVPRDKDDAP